MTGLPIIDDLRVTHSDHDSAEPEPALVFFASGAEHIFVARMTVAEIDALMHALGGIKHSMLHFEPPAVQS